MAKSTAQASAAPLPPLEAASRPRGSSAYIGMVTVGFGLYLAWQNILMNPSLVPPANAGFSVGNWFYLQDVLFLALLALGFFVARKRPALPHRIPVFWIAAAIMAVGTLTEYLCGYGDTLNMAGALTGYFCSAARAVFILLWGEMLCTLEPRDSLVCICGGYAIGFLFNLAASTMNPIGVFAFHSLLPLLSGVFYHALRRESSAGTIVRCNPRVLLTKLPFVLLIGIGLFGFVFRLLFDFSEMRVAVPDEVSTVYAGLAVAALLMIGAILYKREIDYTRFGRLIMPLVVLLALIIAITESGHQSYEAFAIGAAWLFYKLFSWAIYRAVAYRSAESPIVVFAIGNILLNLCTYVPLLIIHALPLPADHTVMAAIIITCALLISYFMLRDSQLDSLFARDDRALERIVRANREGTVEECVAAAGEEFGLTEREREIALKVLQGESNESILAELFISKNTLRTHLHNIYDKTDTHSREELVGLLLAYK